MPPVTTGPPSEDTSAVSPGEHIDDVVDSFDIISEDDIEIAKRTTTPILQKRASYTSFSYLAGLVRSRFDNFSGSISCSASEGRPTSKSETLTSLSDDGESSEIRTYLCYDQLQYSEQSAGDTQEPTAIHVGEDFQHGYRTGTLKVNVSYKYQSRRLDLALSKISDLLILSKDVEESEQTVCLLQAVLLPERSYSDCCQSVRRALEPSGEASFNQLLEWLDVSPTQLQASRIELSAWNAQHLSLIGVVDLPLSFLQTEDDLNDRSAVCYLHRRDDVEDSAQVHSIPRVVESPSAARDQAYPQFKKKKNPFSEQIKRRFSHVLPRRIMSNSMGRLHEIPPMNLYVDSADDDVFEDSLLKPAEPRPRRSSWGGSGSRLSLLDLEAVSLQPIERTLLSQSEMLSSITPLQAFTSPDNEINKELILFPALCDDEPQQEPVWSYNIHAANAKSSSKVDNRAPRAKPTKEHIHAVKSAIGTPGFLRKSSDDKKSPGSHRQGGRHRFSIPKLPVHLSKISPGHLSRSQPNISVQQRHQSEAGSGLKTGSSS